MQKRRHLQHLQQKIALLIVHVNCAAPLEAESIALIITKVTTPCLSGDVNSTELSKSQNYPLRFMCLPFVACVQLLVMMITFVTRLDL